MAQILVGTSYGQVISLNPQVKKAQKSVYGTLGKQPVVSVLYYPDQKQVYYATGTSISSVVEGQVNEEVKLHGKERVIHMDGECVDILFYVLSNGSFWYSALDREGSTRVEARQDWKGENHNIFSGAALTRSDERFLLYGKGVVPEVVDMAKGMVGWKGKNVKHDELDLEVPINDVGGQFFSQQKMMALLNSDNKLRIYDIRGTHRRPIKEILIKAAPRSNMTKLLLSDQDATYYYVANDVGEVYQLDSRKEGLMSAKYKGITTSVTGLQVGGGQVYVASRDCYVRVYDEVDRSLKRKYYMNKPISALSVAFCEKEEQKILGEGEVLEEEEDLEEEEEGQSTLKMKFIRKRNKVGLKYLQPQQFDTPEQAEIKMEEDAIKKEQWYRELNEVDRKQFQEQ